MNARLLRLELPNTENGVEKIGPLIQRVKDKDPTLTEIDLSSKNIDDEEFIKLFLAMAENDEINSLKLNNCCLGKSALDALSTLLFVTKSLSHLELRGNNIGAIEASSLANGLKANKTLVYLDMSSNDILSKGAKSLADALKTNRVLKGLRIGDNHIGDAGIKELTDALSLEDSVLEYLDIESNLIGDRSARHVANWVQKSTVVKHINMQNNILQEPAMQVIVSAMKNNFSMLNFEVTVKGGLKAYRNDIKELLNRNRTELVRRIHMQHNVFLTMGVRALRHSNAGKAPALENSLIPISQYIVEDFIGENHSEKESKKRVKRQFDIPAKRLCGLWQMEFFNENLKREVPKITEEKNVVVLVK